MNIKKMGAIKMERIYINRDCCIAYTVLALHSIYYSANKERTIEDIVEEIKTMFQVYEDETNLMTLMKRIMSKEGQYKVKVIRHRKKSK